MRKLALLASAAGLAVALPSTANAGVCVGGSETAPTVTGPLSGTVACFYPGDPEFTTSPFPASTGVISASFKRDGLGAGTFTDLFQFIYDEDGLGAGSVTTNASLAFGTTDLDFLEVWVNGISVPITKIGLFEVAGVSNFPITSGVLNTIQIEYLSRGAGSYGGQANIVPLGVPEPASWAMMLFGFGAIGFGLRRRRKETARVRFAF